MPSMPGRFRPKGQPSRKEQVQAYDARRGSARERGYTTAWDKASLGHRHRHPLCVGCSAVGRVEPATVTDHVVPHEGDQGLFWDKANWQSSCGWHHDVVKQRLEVERRAGRFGDADMRLDSAAAVQLTRTLDPTGGGGVQSLGPKGSGPAG